MNIIYEKTGIKGSPITVWERLAKFITESTSDPQLERIMGSQNAESLRKYLANISTDVSDFNSSKQMGQENDGSYLMRSIRYKINEVLTFLSEMNF